MLRQAQRCLLVAPSVGEDEPRTRTNRRQSTPADSLLELLRAALAHAVDASVHQQRSHTVREVLQGLRRQSADRELRCPVLSIVQDVLSSQGLPARSAYSLDRCWLEQHAACLERCTVSSSRPVRGDRGDEKQLHCLPVPQVPGDRHEHRSYSQGRFTPQILSGAEQAQLHAQCQPSRIKSTLLTSVRKRVDASPSSRSIR